MLSDGKSWLDVYLEYTANQEAPTIFHKYVGIFLLAAVTQRKVWLDRGSYQIYPNFYLFFVADSGGCRKSVANGIGIELLHEVNHRLGKNAYAQNLSIFHERLTLEGLMDQLNKVIIVPPEWQIPFDKRNSTKTIANGSAIIVADELTNLFNSSAYSKDLLAFFTAAYTCKSNLSFLTRNHGNCQVRNPFINILAATTPDQFGVAIPEDAKKSGFLGRTLVITSKGTGNRISYPTLRMDLQEFLLEYLIKVSQVYGKMVMEPDAEIYFNEWYQNLPFELPPGMLAAFYQRIHDHIFRVAMILSLAESTKLIIRKKHLEMAMEMIYSAAQDMEHAMRYVGGSKDLLAKDDLLEDIQKTKKEGMLHTDIIKKYHRKFSSFVELKMALDTLQEGRMIVAATKNNGLYYTAWEYMEGKDKKKY